MLKYTFILLPVVFAVLLLQNDPSPGRSDAMTTIPVEDSFLMPVEDVFSITGRGTVVTGKIERGKIKAGDSVEIVGLSATPLKSKVTGIEMFRKLLTEAGKGDNVGLLLSGIDKSQIKRGMVISRPGYTKAFTEFQCEISLLKSEGGTIIKPLVTNTRKQFYFRTVDISGVITLPPGKELQPGETTTAIVVLTEPVAMELNLEFILRDGGKTTGKGKVVNMIK